MDPVRKAAGWVSEQVALARDRQRQRIEDDLSRLDEVDERAREYVRLRRQMPGYTWDQEAEKHRLRLIGLAAQLADDEAGGLIERLTEAPVPESDEAYKAMARRLAVLRRLAFEERG